MPEQKKKLLKRLKSAGDLNQFMADYYRELDDASKSGKQKIAWCSSVGPAELLRGMGFLTYFRKPIQPCWAPPEWPPT